jgi:hypothetical protein
MDLWGLLSFLPLTIIPVAWLLQRKVARRREAETRRIRKRLLDRDGKRHTCQAILLPTYLADECKLWADIRVYYKPLTYQGMTLCDVHAFRVINKEFAEGRTVEWHALKCLDV